MKRFLIPLIAVSVYAMGCVEDKHDYNQCKDIEYARCELRANCQTAAYQNEDPEARVDFDDRFPDFELEQCISHAREHCGTKKLGAKSRCKELSINICVDQCVEAILNLGPRFDAGVMEGPHCDDLERGIDETLPLPECDFVQTKDENEDLDRDAG